FHSNVRLEHYESGETVVAINSFLVNTSICLTLDIFGEFLKLSPSGELNEKGPSNSALNVLKLDPPPTSSSAPPSALPLSDMSAAILGVITCLSEEFRGFHTQVDDAFERVNNNVSGLDSRMPKMEENIAFLMSQFPPPPPPPPSSL
ncbi:hypothetical protein Golax_018116, partial [Gossypium laxum]|nr:hypothetical protein [Gossypium laxum]